MTEAGVRSDFVHATLEDLIETTSDIGDEGEEDSTFDSCSTFSLQQCIDEFRARRLRRTSVPYSEQRDDQQQQCESEKADDDLINQNRSNKEHERKCKPCKNGFCYCFTSDSGDGGVCGAVATAANAGTANAARATAYNLRAARRCRKSESGQATAHSQVSTSKTVQQHRQRKSAPANLPIFVESSKSVTPKKKQSMRHTAIENGALTAVSRLETTTHDAPLIHIIQELRDNCVVSEVRVNKHKLQAKKRNTKPQLNLEDKKVSPQAKVAPTAPPLEMQNSPDIIETLSGDSIPVTSLKINSKSPRKKPGAGRLLQKRLSHTNIEYKPRDMKAPPPKPPRASAGSHQKQGSISSVPSMSPSLREAERIVDEFLLQNGVPIPKSTKLFKKRMSFPLTHSEAQTFAPSCPSLSEIERFEDGKETKQRNYNKNLRKSSEQQTVKDISFGWKEPKVSEMLNYDTNGNRKEFKSQAAQAEPQSIGWQIPPKLSLDTVDGAVRHNLASNLATKVTPVKSQFNSKRNQNRNQKFGWRNIKPWAAASTQKCPRNFLKQSKKKILKLVTPKKDNKENGKIFQARKTPYRNVGIQTSPQDFAHAYEQCTNAAQSPPGSYHSATAVNYGDGIGEVTPQDSTTATNSTNTNSQNNNTSDSLQFDFTRKVSSPPKKSTRTQRNTQRKLDFPSVCGASGGGGFCFNNQQSTADSAPSFGSARRQTIAGRTYRSYNTDLDQDAAISKMGFILSNIRARLEASDEHAIRTFEEIERREQQQHRLMGFDCPDSLGIRRRTNVDVHTTMPIRNFQRNTLLHEPIYSEIEEDSIHVTESPQFDNKTGIESSSSAAPPTTSIIDIENLYAKVNKPPKNLNNHPTSGSIALGQFLHDSLRRAHIERENQTLPIVTEPSVSYVSYSSPPFETSSQETNYNSPTTTALSHCQSLNNIRVMEQHSPPKRNRNLSKSDLSLHRSEIFLENLCRSELIVKGGAVERLEKVDNHLSNRLEHVLDDADIVSYDIPNELPNEATARTSVMQTPQKFLTKPTDVHFKNYQLNTTSPNMELKLSRHSMQKNMRSSSCPTTPRKIYNTPDETIAELSLEEDKYEILNATTHSTTETSTALTRYKRLKQALQKSFRKSKDFVKTRRASLPQVKTTTPTTKTTIEIREIQKSLIRVQTPQPQALPPTPTKSSTSCLHLDELFQLDEASSVTEQIARAVSICRQMPELENSHEMVEAERLLLFSTLRQDIIKPCTLRAKTSEITYERNFSIKTLRLPVDSEVDLAGYFNYYFTITFEYDGQIHSTQSTECRRGEVFFRNIDIEFKMKKSHNNLEEPCINCHIFMLRLRKISNLPTVQADTNEMFSPYNDITPLPSTPLSSASSLDGITSRFRLYASFSINANSFKHYQLNSNIIQNINETNQQNLISLSAFNSCQIPLQLCSPLTTEAAISVNASVTAQFPPITFNGFLHVQDPLNQHNWNWRWCTLLGLQLQIWTDANGLSESPLLSLDLESKIQMLPLIPCSRELCARKRSFCLQCTTKKIDAEIATAAIFFAADNDADLEQWLQHLNEIFNFIVKWMQ